MSHIYHETMLYGVCFIAVFTVFTYLAGVSLSKLGADVHDRAITDDPGLHHINPAFNFKEDGRILGWLLWAENVGKARVQVIILAHEQTIIGDGIWSQMQYQFKLVFIQFVMICLW